MNGKLDGDAIAQRLDGTVETAVTSAMEKFNFVQQGPSLTKEDMLALFQRFQGGRTDSSNTTPPAELATTSTAVVVRTSWTETQDGIVRVRHTPIGHKLRKTSLSDAIKMWETGQVVEYDEATGTVLSKTVPFRGLQRSDWTDQVSRTLFGRWRKVFTKLSALKTLCNTDSFSNIVGTVESCVEYCRRKRLGRTGAASASANSTEYRVKPLDRSVNTTYQIMTSISRQDITNWFEEYCSTE